MPAVQSSDLWEPGLDSKEFLLDLTEKRILRTPGLAVGCMNALFLKVSEVSKGSSSINERLLTENFVKYVTALERVTWWTDKEGLNLLECRSRMSDGC